MQQLQTSSLNGSDLHEILSIAQQIEGEQDYRTSVKNTLQVMETVMESASSVFFELDQTGNTFVEAGSHGVPVLAPKQWTDEYQLEDPFVGAMLDKIENKTLAVTISSELISHREYIKTNFYNLFLKPQSIYHVLVMGLLQNGKPLGLFGFHRPYGAQPFTHLEVTKAALLAPTLAACISSVQAKETLRERDWVIETLAKDIPYQGALILDNNFDVIYANSGARELLALPAGGFVSASRIPTELLETCNSLLSDSARPHHIELRQVHAKVDLCAGESGSPRFVVYLGPTGEDVIAESQLIRHGLTAREIEIVQLVGAGMTNPQVAELLCISPRTVQNHLRSIYAKVGVHNRTSLLYRLASNT